MHDGERVFALLFHHDIYTLPLFNYEAPQSVGLVYISENKPVDDAAKSCTVLNDSKWQSLSTGLLRVKKSY